MAKTTMSVTAIALAGIVCFDTSSLRGTALATHDRPPAQNDKKTERIHLPDRDDRHVYKFGRHQKPACREKHEQCGARLVDQLAARQFEA